VISGIYQFKNIVTNTIYIGSAVNLRKRKLRHLIDLRRNRHHSIKFQRSYNKYGEDSFEYDVLEYVEIDSLILFEQKYLDSILFANVDDERFDIIGLNIGRNAGNSIGQKRTDEAKKKMSNIAKKRFETDKPWNKGKNDIYTPEAIERMSSSKRGVKLSHEHVKKVIKNLKIIQNGHIFTEETKNKISLSRCGKGVISIDQYSFDNQFISSFSSIKEVSETLKICRSGISAVCRGIQKTCGGFIWKYKS
jgi:group I intron endonuclease